MKKIYWGIIGCGKIAHSFADALKVSQDSIRYAAASRNDKKASEFAEKHGFTKWYDSYTALVEDPEVDIIYVATPHSYHYAHVKLSLEAGKHVLCEKPFTVNNNQLRELVSIAKKRNLFLMEALWTRFLPGIIKAKELISKDVIGKIITLEADFGINFPFDPEHRIYNPYLAGGALLDLGIYPLFLSLFLLGKPVELFAHSIVDKNKIDLTTSIISRSASGAMCHLNTTVLANTPVTAGIYGTRGKIEFHSRWFAPTDFTLIMEGEKRKTYSFPIASNGLEYEANEAVSCLQKNTIESNIMPHDFSIMLMDYLDNIRKMTGIIYPEEIESVEIPYGWNEL